MIKIRQILAARAVRQVAAIQILEFRPDTIRKIQERYSFLKVPTSYDEMVGTDASQGIQFHHGKFQHGHKTIVVELLQFLPGMIIAETRSSTDDSDLFLEDYVKNANATNPETITPTGPTLYSSQVEFVADRLLDKLVPAAPSANQAIDRLLMAYGLKVPSFAMAGIVLNLDPTGLGGIIPNHFTIERRKDFPYAANVCFSQAPLKTDDHRLLLESLDRAAEGGR